MSILAAAGPLAERRYYIEAGLAEDEDDARWLADFMRGTEHDTEVIARCWPGEAEDLYDLTRQVMASHWTAVDEVAALLLSRRRAVTPAEVLAVMNP